MYSTLVQIVFYLMLIVAATLLIVSIAMFIIAIVMRRKGKNVIPYIVAGVVTLLFAAAVCIFIFYSVSPASYTPGNDYPSSII